MKVLIACEYSGIIRDEFIKKKHDAWSCDILETEKPGPHIKGDVLNILNNGWDLMIAHPPCTHLAVSGAAWFKKKGKELQKQAMRFVWDLYLAPIKHICIENPISVISTWFKKPTQIIQPYMFGHKEQKSTCLWLKNLPALIPTNNVYIETMKLPEKERMRLHYLPPSKDRGKIRSKTFLGIAEAMADQWGNNEII